MPKISIVIPYWNGEEKIKKHLPGVLQFARDNKVAEVIASDDASTDGTVKLLKSQFPDIVVVERQQNKGFASNVNTGFSYTKGDYVFLLNSDASPDKDVLKFALPHFIDNKVFSVGCRVDEGLWAVGKFQDGFFWHDQSHKVGPHEAEAHKTLWASGGGSIFRKTVWDELGGLDTLYDPFYVEDVDLGYRAWKRGYINLWEPKSLVDHYNAKGVIESNFSQRRIRNTADRNLLIFIWKNITSKKMISDHEKALVQKLLHHPGYWLIFLAAFSRWTRIMKKRKIEKQAEKLTDEEVLSIFT